ncbi:sensor histidine kinase [Devosia sp. SL43]|uniref:sensor histidine kinase n=1 Tax=Devosia sp. SL43 TaxID=2806348 RepID=UPI001EFF643E|nr:HWE histidine kinase domain-containing protein [Devosia sp. SL43]UJW87116.1 GAF domain-containing protein [Devosia sp. SL43]
MPDSVRAVIDDPIRLGALDALNMTDEPDADFARLSRTVAHIFKAEFGLVTLVGAEWQSFHGCFGAEGMTGNKTELSFCAHTLASPDDVTVVLDASTDERFKANLLVTDAPQIRFYAGAPIIIAGQRLGTLCVLSARPRDAVDPALLEQLVDLAGVAAALFALKDEARVRARTAAALLREEWRHALTLEAGKVGSWVWDVRTGEVACNDMFRRMYGLAESGPVRVDDVLEATHPADRATVRSGIEASLRDGVDYGAEARVGNSGRWLTMRGRVYQRDAEGKALIMMGASIDITESKQSADQTRLLLRELNHRVKNTLAMIQSVARQTIRQNPDPRAFIEAFSGRLRTISDAHVLLADRDWSGVQLYEVIASQLGPNFLTNPDRAEVSGSDVMLPADHALGLGLILHELTTNAMRHGAWSDDKGTVSIRWDIKTAPERGLALNWREIGGPQVSPPQEHGLGTRLIERSLAKVLDSEVKLDFTPDGVVADVWLPLPTEDN